METVSQRWNQPKYRAISSTSMVDETLFGSSQNSGRDGSKLGGSLSGSRKVVKGPLAPSAVVISTHELERIKVQTSHHTSLPFLHLLLLLSLPLYSTKPSLKPKQKFKRNENEPKLFVKNARKNLKNVKNECANWRKKPKNSPRNPTWN